MEYLSSLFDTIQSMLVRFSNTVPLELFVLIGAFIEEIVAPIPSPFVTTLAGSAASAKQYPIIMLGVLAIIGSIGKTLGAYLIYKVADIGEDFILTKFGRLLGVSHSSVEKMGSKLHNKKHSWWIVMSLRAFPAVPSAPVSVVCGVIKMRLLTYLSATFIGNIIRNLIYLYFGYAGVSAYAEVLQGFDTAESLLKIGTFVGIGCIVAWILFKKKSNKNL